MKLYHVSKNQHLLCISCIRHLPVVSQSIADKHIESMLLIAQVSHFLIFFIKNHSCKRNMPRSANRLKNIIWKKSRIETHASISSKTHYALKNPFGFAKCVFVQLFLFPLTNRQHLWVALAAVIKLNPSPKTAGSIVFIASLHSYGL